MAGEFYIAPEAESDIAEAYGWYEARSPGLGEQFLTSLDTGLSNILREPALYPLVHGNCRRALLRRFPYAVFFERTDQFVTVLAVFHTSRDPRKWKQRVP